MRALIVDDSSAMRAILRMILKQAGFATEEARYGEEALAKLAGSPVPDLTLLDWNMPGMNGLEVVKRLRADHRLDRMQVMMVTTEAESRELGEALEAGANEYVMKPFTRDVITTKLQILGFQVEQ
jgi:two-component system, chemotaxis family, chemotaxis protein CheY